MRYQQPQNGPAQIDWSNPLTSGLSFAFLPSGYVNKTAQNPSTFTAGVVLTPGTSGVAMDIASTSSQNGLTVASALDFSLQTGGCTLIVVCDSITAGVGGSQGFLGIDSNNFFGYNTSSIPIIKTGGTVQATASAAINGTGPYVIAYSYLRGTIAKIYINGVLVASATPSVVGIDYSPTLFGHVSATSTHGRQKIYGAALFSRGVLSDAQVAAISANPWQVFKQPQRRMWAIASGGTVNPKTLTASISTTPTVSRIVNATRSATQSNAATLKRAISATKNATQSSAPLVSRSVSAIRSTTQSSVATSKKSIGKILSASSAVAATIGSIKAKIVTLTASIGSSAQMTRSITAIKTATIATSGLVQKVITKTFAASSALLATKTAIKVKILILTASIGTSASKVLRIGAIRSAGISSAASIARAMSISRLADITIQGSIVKSNSKTIVATVGLVAQLIALIVHIGSLLPNKRFLFIAKERVRIIRSAISSKRIATSNRIRKM